MYACDLGFFRVNVHKEKYAMQWLNNLNNFKIYLTGLRLIELPRVV